jgi:hypothetical protein
MRGRHVSDAWSTAEVDAIVADYFSMLTMELRGEAYNKTAHRTALGNVVGDRTSGSIERKHQNISAALIGLGYPYISGYKPLSNYQHLLFDVVAERVESDCELRVVVASAVDEPAFPLPESGDILARLEAPPEPRDRSYLARESGFTPAVPHPGINYLEREAQNASLGLAGEEFIVWFERARLTSAGADRLAQKVEHVSIIKGDGLGFDIHSFEEDGTDRLIEVKTTAYGKQTPFFVSRNEVAVSGIRDDSYHLYRVFEYRRNAKLFTVHGALERVCELEAVQFQARIA